MRIVLVMIIGGAALVFFGVQEWRLSSSSKAEAQTITCADLEKRGPGDNAHVNLSDCFIWLEAYVCQEKSGSSTWQEVWAPVVPIGGEYHKAYEAALDEQGNLVGEVPTPARINVIFKSKSIRNENELYQFAAGRSISGMVVNQIDSLGSEEKKILADNYPGIDFDKCWIIEHGRKPKSMGVITGMVGGGAALILLPVGYMVTRRKSA